VKPSLVFMGIWTNLGYEVIVFLAALKTVPRHLLEAAELDGANAWQRFRNVTFPSISPTVFFVSVTGTIATLQSFDQFWVMTRGGPAYGSATYMLYVYMLDRGHVPDDLAGNVADAIRQIDLEVDQRSGGHPERRDQLEPATGDITGASAENRQIRVGVNVHRLHDTEPQRTRDAEPDVLSALFVIAAPFGGQDDDARLATGDCGEQTVDATAGLVVIEADR
jgi:hypothetical protein